MLWLLDHRFGMGLLPLTGCALWKEKPTIMPAESYRPCRHKTRARRENLPTSRQSRSAARCRMLDIEFERPVDV